MYIEVPMTLRPLEIQSPSIAPSTGPRGAGSASRSARQLPRCPAPPAPGLLPACSPNASAASDSGFILAPWSSCVRDAQHRPGPWSRARGFGRWQPAAGPRWRRVSLTAMALPQANAAKIRCCRFSRRASSTWRGFVSRRCGIGRRFTARGSHLLGRKSKSSFDMACNTVAWSPGSSRPGQSRSLWKKLVSVCRVALKLLRLGSRRAR